MAEKLGKSETGGVSSPSASRPLLESRLGYQFRNRDLMRMALTPPSSGISPNNQRLEYLGDAILQCCVSQLVFLGQPAWEEGAMSKLRGMLVCTESLRDWAQELDLELERGPRSLKKPSDAHLGKPMADAMEAILAAIYLDAERAGEDPMKAVMELVKKRFEPSIRAAVPGIWEARDSKTTLQERASSAGLPAPIYELVERSGPDHEPRFFVRVRVGPLQSNGTAGTLKRAQTEAARNLLGLLP
jgi:ribonuclease III